MAEKCRMYANHGALIKHEHKMEGVNSRMDGIQAAILNVKLNYIIDWNDRRIDIAKLYIDRLKNIEELSCLKLEIIQSIHFTYLLLD